MAPHAPTRSLISLMNARVNLFRKLALALADAKESSHMGHPDFRLNDRIFATLSAQARGLGTLKLTIEQQQSFIAEMPRIFQPVHGGWGRMGMTFIDLHLADEATLHGALTTAYNNVKPKQAAKKATSTTKRTSPPARNQK